MNRVDFTIGRNNVPFYGFIHDDLSVEGDNIYRSRPAVIVVPGGGYSYHCLRTEDPVVIPLLREGYQVFVLRYSLGEDIRKSSPEEELALSVRMLKERHEEFDIDPERIALLGMSAGGHLAGALACHWPVYGIESKPDSAVLCYPVISTGKYTHQESADNITLKDSSLIKYYSLENQVTDNTIPCFLWHTAGDDLVDVRNSLLFYYALLEHRIPSELHIYEKGEHGLALGHRETGHEMKRIQSWFPIAASWLNERWDFVL